MMNALDEIDIRILGILQQNARFTNKEIADKTGKSVTAVLERIKKMEETGLIQKYVAILDKNRIDKTLVAFTTVQLKEHSTEALQRFLTDGSCFQEVMECYHLTGQYDFLLKIAIKDMAEYNDFLMKKLASLPNIASVQSYFVLYEGKVETAYALKGSKIPKKQ